MSKSNLLLHSVIQILLSLWGGAVVSVFLMLPFAAVGKQSYFVEGVSFFAPVVASGYLGHFIARRFPRSAEFGTWAWMVPTVFLLFHIGGVASSEGVDRLPSYYFESAQRVTLGLFVVPIVCSWSYSLFLSRGLRRRG